MKRKFIRGRIKFVNDLSKRDGKKIKGSFPSIEKKIDILKKKALGIKKNIP